MEQKNKKKLFFKEYHKCVAEKSHAIDGTYISKYSEKVLNSVATMFYYIGVVAAIGMICFSVYFILYGIYLSLGGGNEWDSPSASFFVAIYMFILAIVAYFAGVLAYSVLRTLTNISLSLKILVNNRPGSQQFPQNISAGSNKVCPDCGTINSVGRHYCSECGCPLD